MNEIVNYLESKSISYRLVGDEVLLTCPQCGKEKLSINTHSGVYQCWVCQAEHPETKFAKGHINHLKEYFGDIISFSSIVQPISKEKEPTPDFTEQAKRYAHSLFSKQGKKGLRYLVKRGFTEESIKKFGFGFTTRYKQDWISIPVYDNDGLAKLLKYRKIPPYNQHCEIKEKYIREKGGESLLFNCQILDKFDEVIVVEGEFDAAILIQVGYENIVGTTVGASTLKPAWYDELVMLKKVYLCFDSDSVGQTAAKKTWATRLGIGKCYNVVLPEEKLDVSEMYLRNKEEFKQKFDNLIKEAKKFSVDGVISLSDALLEMYNRSHISDSDLYFESPWPSLNFKLERGIGFARKRMVAISGISSVGKTTFTLQFIYHHLIKGTPALMLNAEMDEVDLAVKIIQLTYDITYKEVRLGDALLYLPRLGQLPFYLAYAPKITTDIITETMRVVRDRYGISIFCLDNINLIVRSDKESDYGRCTKQLYEATRQLDILSLIIAQPRKMLEGERITREHLKGSNALYTDMDAVLLLNRKRRKDETGLKIFDDTCEVIIDKSRFSPGGIVRLNFIGDKSRFVEIAN